MEITVAQGQLAGRVDYPRAYASTVPLRQAGEFRPAAKTARFAHPVDVA